MNEYKYVVIDAQYYLRRQFSVLKENEDFSKEGLLDSFLWVTLKLLKNFPGDKIILLWDKRPYRKTEVIDEYKTNRYNANEELEKVDAKLETETDEEKRKQLEEERKIHERESELFAVFGSVKYELLAEFSKFGFVSINEAGFEADDLARLLSILATERKEKMLLVSRDSDWICMANEYSHVLYYRNMNDGGFELYTDETNPYKSNYPGIDPFHNYQINCILYGNHNNIELPEEYKNFSIDQISKCISENKVDEIKEFYKYYQALYIDDYMPDIKPRLLKAMLNEGKMDRFLWLEYQESNGISIYPYYYLKVLSCVDKSLYKD